jgi:hypothetical protein
VSVVIADWVVGWVVMADSVVGWVVGWVVAVALWVVTVDLVAL